jgi:uncharacterized membrane protein
MIRRDALSEYVRGSLWVLPALSVLAALAAGSLLSLVTVGPHSPLAFEGTSGDARTLLIGIAGTMITVIAVLLGLTVVALQLSSTQYSPRLLRNFLRDRPNQVVPRRVSATVRYCAPCSEGSAWPLRSSLTSCATRLASCTREVRSSLQKICRRWNAIVWALRNI